MRSFALASLIPLICILTLGAAEPSPEPDEGNDAKILIGNWEVVKGVKEGVPVPANEVNGLKMRIAKDTITIVPPDPNGRTEVAGYKLEVKSKPRALDLEMKRNGGKTIKGIYKIEKGQVTLCFSHQGKDRPKSFDEKAYTVLVMRREKAGK